MRYALSSLALLLQLGCAQHQVVGDAPEPEPWLVGPGTKPEPGIDLAPDEPAVPGGGPDPMTLGPAESSSVGSPVEGYLLGGVPLPLEGRGYVYNPAKDPLRRFGTVEVVQALIRAAAEVEQRHPGGTLTINDIALPGGGEITGHASHRSGRDVDVLFYLVTGDGEPCASKAIPIEPDGSGVDYRDLSTGSDDVPVRLDVPRTWAFVAALVAEPTARINRIYVVEHVRRLLLAHAEATGAQSEIVERFGHLTCQPGFPHDDHFHIRFYCAVDDIAAGCRDTYPIYPWQQAHVAAQGAAIKLAGRRRKPRPKLTSVADAVRRARRKHGRFHEDVTAFLERRKAWVHKPHPGRKHCP